MTQIGYTISSEEHGPNELVDHAVRAEEVGFEFASISDHYHPWISQQGNAPFVWSTLGGVARATDDLPVGVGVNCPIMRMHPAIVAQAAATAATMFEGKFFLGVGTGERLNEHVTGEHWPEHAVRTEMLEEAIEIIRKLWQGGQQSYYGDHFTVENARLYTLPEEHRTSSSPPTGSERSKPLRNSGTGSGASVRRTPWKRGRRPAARGRDIVR